MHFGGTPIALPFFSMTTNTDLWHKTALNIELLDTIAESDLTAVSTMQTLRKKWDVDEITIAASIVDARRRAQQKLVNADALIADSIGVQQATSTAIAIHKAKRFLCDGPVFDLCCGIGSDLRELPKHTIGIDNDALRCSMAEHNTGKNVRCCDVLSFDISKESFVHIDPARRSCTQRLHGLDAMQPSIEELLQIVKKCAGGCIKVSPATNLEDLENFPVPFELEYIEEGGRVVQCVIWFGELASNAEQLTATSMSINKTISAYPDYPSFIKVVEGYLFVPNPALERSGLHYNIANEIGAKELAPHLGIFCSTESIDSDWFQQFEILETTSLRLEKVKKVLQNNSCTQVEVKTRGKTVDPNEWQNELSSDSTGTLLTVFALRLGKKRIAILTRRL